MACPQEVVKLEHGPQVTHSMATPRKCSEISLVVTTPSKVNIFNSYELILLLLLPLVNVH